MTGDDLKKYLQREAAAKMAEATQIASVAFLADEFPDLARSVDRWKKEHYSSKLANSKATLFDIYHSCGCCSDSPLFVSPYFVHASGKRVYAEPYRTFIGERDSMCGERPDHEWRESLAKAGYAPEVIQGVEAYFAAHYNSRGYEEDEESAE